MAKKAEQQQKPGLTETQRWVLGASLLFFAGFLLISVASYYFCWRHDQMGVLYGGGEAPDNPGGPIGAKLAHWLVGEGFGVFGIAVPAVLLVLGLRIMNFRPAALTKSVQIGLLGMLWGSLTLGFLFKEQWGVFGTGLGGAQGIWMARLAVGYLGSMGTGLLLLFGWILLGVYITRRTIDRVNRIGKGIYNKVSELGVRSEELGVEGEEDEPAPQRHSEHSCAAGEGSQREEGIAPWEEEPAAAKTVDNAPRTAILRHAQDDATKETPLSTLHHSHSTQSGFLRGSLGEALAAASGSSVLVDAAAQRAGANAVPLDEPSPEETVDPRGIEIVRPPEPDHAPEPQPQAATEPAVVEFGQSAGSYIRREGIAQAPQNPRDLRETWQVGVHRVPKMEVVHTEKTDDAAAETTPPSTLHPPHSPLDAGGVLEAAAQGDMHVVKPSHNDAELDDDEFDATLYDPTLKLSRYQKPLDELLDDHSVEVRVTEEEIYENRNQIETTLLNFGIKIDKIKATIGPTVTLYEIVPSAGVKISKIKNLEDDIALSLKALGIRIIAPMPGRGTIGIEVPNKDKQVVSMRSVVRAQKFKESKAELPVVLGKTISNETFVIDLTQMPHLLVAGATGQGKSVGLNAIITSLLYRKHPAELKFVFVDPKRVELSLYAKLEKHFLAKMESEEEAILTDTQKVVYTLNSLCQLMSTRYDLLRAAGVKKISEYNEKFKNRRLNPNKGHDYMPYIVVVIDEFADLIMTAGREIETPLTRLAQLARAVGIHLVIATQRPDVKVITGLIKANFPARIAFRVMSMVDSRTIIDQPGANQLIGRGDMLISLNGELTRVQCAFIDTPEIERVTEFVGRQTGCGIYLLPDYTPEGEGVLRPSGDDDSFEDTMFDEVARFVVQNQQGSTSAIQRRFSLGYNRAGRLMDELERRGIVGRANGSKPREVLIMSVDSLDML